MTNKITEETTLKEILSHPQAEKILMKYNLPCLSCPMASFEMDKLRIGMIAERYELNLGELLKDLNKVIK
ncbi:MAG: DUF1858 domain-containing protein [Patescibacteria group bacterium]|nr:DUF1858 domain-containing protein [Patescibacteria group bacterium]MDD5164796.1 DUF1858 domain-containing protein [Patescibacteria group bacterium]MDD5534782.1 DUF1858 domain-containing protein [Patescibacteria group bacterium]